MPALSTLVATALALLASSLTHLLTGGQYLLLTALAQLNLPNSLTAIVQSIQSVVQSVLGPLLQIVNRVLTAASAVSDLALLTQPLAGLLGLLSKLNLK